MAGPLIILAGFAGAVAEGRRAPPRADDARTPDAVARRIGPRHRSLRTLTTVVDRNAATLAFFAGSVGRRGSPLRALALPVVHDFATLALLAGSVRQHGSGWALTVGRRPDHAAGAFRFAHLGCVIPVLPLGTFTVGRRADRGRWAGIVTGLVYLNLIGRAHSIAVRRHTDGSRPTFRRPAGALTKGRALWAAVRRRAVWPVRRAEAFGGLAAGAVFVRLV